MRRFFVSVCWQNEKQAQRTSPLRERRMTWTIDAMHSTDAIGFVKDWVTGRPNSKGWHRRITFAAATEIS